jgi:hypothetical protein
MAADGKKYNSDMLDSEGVISLSKSFPNNRAIKFLDWFLYSDTSIDGQSRKGIGFPSRLPEALRPVRRGGRHIPFFGN